VAVSPSESLNLDDFWRRFSRLVGRLMKEHAHCEVVLTLQDGVIQLVRVNRSFRPGALPPAE